MLEVPLDYSNLSIRTTSIAFMKLSALNASESTENILLNFGKMEQALKTRLWEMISDQ
jgi:hypothetical protein